MSQATRASRDVAHHLAPVPAADATMDRQLAALKAAELAACHAYLAQGDALLDLWDTSPADTRCGRRPHVLAEAGLLLGLDPLTVGARLHVAEALRTHPMLRALLSSGRITVPHALAAVDERSVLGADSADDDEAIELADRALHEVLLAGGLLGWDSTPGRLRTALRRALIRLDPVGAARRRQEQTAARTRVRLRARADGLADWTSTGPAPQLQAADRLLEILSGAAGPDDPRTYGQRQLDALLAALVARAPVPRSPWSCSSRCRLRRRPCSATPLPARCLTPSRSAPS